MNDDGRINASTENGNLMFMLWMVIDLHNFYNSVERERDRNGEREVAS